MSTESSPQTMREFLAGAGQVGHDLLEVDWEATPLGPIEDWPNALTTVVRVLLTSRFAMWMAWGPELTFLCNGAYRRDTLGQKYPWALGRPAREVWAEIWPEIGPRIETVLQHRRGHLGRGAHAHPRAQRLSGGDLPHVLLQPAARRRRRHRGHAVRGLRGDRAGHHAAADGDAARARLRVLGRARGARVPRRGVPGAGGQPALAAVHDGLPVRRRRGAPGVLERDRRGPSRRARA